MRQVEESLQLMRGPLGGWLRERGGAGRLVSAMIMKPFPGNSHMHWRRPDVPGREQARIEQTGGGWHLTGDAGHWMLNGAPLPLVEGALDIDLGFTPATNLLPIRRLNLAVGERADVRTAWVRFPELRVEALEQSYQRESARVFRYDAMVDGERFQARLDTDEFGRVLLYEGLWEAEVASVTSDHRGNS